MLVICFLFFFFPGFRVFSFSLLVSVLKKYLEKGVIFKSIVMMFPMIRCYHANTAVPPHSFFILCKGCNAGKPGFQPWTNSFIVVCPHEEYFNFYFWLFYGLFQSGKFKTRHRGSVIPFINLPDVRDCLREIAPLIHPDWSRFKKILSSLDNLNKLKATHAAQIVATDKLQRCLLQKYFLEIKNK